MSVRPQGELPKAASGISRATSALPLWGQAASVEWDSSKIRPGPCVLHMPTSCWP